MRFTQLPIEERMNRYQQAMDLKEEKEWGPLRISKKIGVNQNTLGSWIYRHSRPNTVFRFPDLNPSPELSYVLGVRYGDGSITNLPYRQIGVSLHAKDLEFVEKFNRCITKILHRGYPIHQSAKGEYCLGFSNKVLGRFLQLPLEDQKSIIEKFPIPFIQGMFDSEGYVGKRTITLANTNEDMVKYIHWLLSRLSIESHLSFVPKSKIKGATKDVHVLNITGQENLAKFCMKVGFAIRRKQKKIVKIVKWGSTYPERASAQMKKRWKNLDYRKKMLIKLSVFWNQQRDEKGRFTGRLK